MEKPRRTILVIAICIGIMLGWQFLSQKMGWTPAPQPQAPATADSAGAPDSTGANSVTGQPGQSGHTAQSGLAVYTESDSEVVVETPLYTAKFNTRGGILTSFALKKYTVYSAYEKNMPVEPVQLIAADALPFAPLGVLINNQHSWRNAAWSFEDDPRITLGDGQKRDFTFVGQLGALTLRRTITVDAASYTLHETLNISSTQDQTLSLGFSLSTANVATAQEYMAETRVARLQNGSFEETSSTGDLSQGMSFGNNIAWAGNMSNYFIAAMLPADNAFRLDARLQNGIYSLAFKKDDLRVGPDLPLRSEMSYYLGTKEKAALEQAPNDLISSVDYGWFGWMSRPLMWLLNIFHSFVGNYGVAIILLTVLVKIVLWPLSYKSFKSMQAMKQIQPHVMKLREKYKDDKQRMNQEMMQLYRTYKVNPMGGCLPILVQLPVFIGLYKALLNAFELRQAAFIPYLPFTDNVWLYDLSLQDPYYITPIVMGALMFLQQKLTPAPGDPTQAKIMLFMPVIFVFFFLSFPSGLVVYWLMNSLLSVAQQHWQLNMKGAKKAKS
ncbi:MAG: membrane protein insertase YidC [Deltaproteobacteria bacterium]|jgi:YidC/Oxa1 family membrane protein insertase|nr:membrane protein insertase YidC [Deltaproteobacteria bacterium]